MADEKENPPSAAAGMPRVRRRAPTIDLKATEVAVEPPPGAASESGAEPERPAPPEYSTTPPDYDVRPAGAPQETPPPPPHEPPPPSEEPLPPPPPRPAGSLAGSPAMAGALTGGFIALFILLSFWGSGLFTQPRSQPDPRIATLETRLAELANRPSAPAPAPAPAAQNNRGVEELTARVTRLESAAAAPPAAAPGSGASEESVKAVQSALADLTRRIDENATALREARGRAEAASSAAEAARAAAERSGNTEALDQRIAGLERANKELADAVAKSLAAAGDRPLRAAVAAQALQAAVERGEPFAAELAATRALIPDHPPLRLLEPFAASGLPGPAALARQLSEITPTIVKTAAPAPAGGFLDRLQANAEKLVRVRPIDEVPGNDATAVLSRVQAKASRGDLAGAVAELKSLPDDLRAPADEWIRKVEARNAALNAGRRLVADALAGLGRTSQ